MIQIYLVDYLGVHCGMHYYLEAFKRVLSTVPDASVHILSNYSDDKNVKPFFLNQYKGNKFSKVISLLKNLYRLRRFVLNHPEGVFIYLTYGNAIDLPFMRIVSKAKRHIIDIHEAIAQNVDSKEWLKSRFKSLYKNKIATVISHSTRTDDFLNEYQYEAARLYVPHFKYVFPKEYECADISRDVADAPENDRLNILFFGNLNESKGVDLLIQAANIVTDDCAEKLNIIIAGKNFDDAVYKVSPLSGRSVKIIPRHITDDELRYLYQKTDFISLPYRKTSQSGILEMAFYFKKPIIATEIPYFQKMLIEFPSFGILAGNTAESYAAAIESVLENHDSDQFFTDSDYNRYENRTEINTFISDFNQWLKNIKS